MNDSEKDRLILNLLSDKGLREGEGVQRLAHAMVSPIRDNISGKTQEEFVYVKPENGWRERAQAHGLRELAGQPGVSPGTAAMYERMARSWDEYAKVPKWKRAIIEWVTKRIR